MGGNGWSVSCFVRFLLWTQPDVKIVLGAVVGPPHAGVRSQLYLPPYNFLLIFLIIFSFDHCSLLRKTYLDREHVRNRWIGSAGVYRLMNDGANFAGGPLSSDRSSPISAAPTWPVAPERIEGGGPSARDQYKNIQQLNQSHLAMIELVLDGHSQLQVAQRLALHPSTVSMVLSSPLFQSELSRRRAERNKISDEVSGVRRANALRTLEENLERAADVQVGLLLDEDAKVRQKAVDSIFDRCFGRGGVQPSLDAAKEVGEKGLIVNVQVVQNISNTLREVKELIEGEKV